MSFKALEPFWNSWYIDRFIGEGSCGKVYKVSKQEWGLKLESALKIMTIPSREQYMEAKMSFKGDQQGMNRYFEELVKGIVNEIKLLYALRGNSSIISYEDHLVIKSPDSCQWNILIRMEYATSLLEHMSSGELRQEEVIKLAADICTALEACESNGIVHRDIKDENIFVTKSGSFKLGDFGIAREISREGLNSTARGTPMYLAPEVFRGEPHDSRADLYSLGIVLYKLLNCGRFPFMPQLPSETDYKDKEQSLARRISGEELPGPVNGGGDIGNIILKACAFNPKDRYKNAGEMKKQLEACMKKRRYAEEAVFINLENGEVYTENRYDAEDTQQKAGGWVYL